MLSLIVVAQLAVADPAPARSPLADLVARAVERNRTTPASLREYRAQVESEIAVLTRRADGEEGALSVEQSLNLVHWQRGGDFRQHMTAYRARQTGPSLSALAVLRTAWTIPMLYGNEFGAFFGGQRVDSSGDGAREASTGGVVAVHPFGSEGDRVYAFAGGDTIAIIRTERRAITMVRVKVEPRREQASWPVVVFRGLIDLDADRGEIIRLRGQFITLDRHGPKQKRLFILPVKVMAFVELESAEVDGRYWLPRYQRIETHVNIRGLAEGRSVFRIVSRFRAHEVKGEDANVTEETAFGSVEAEPAGENGPGAHRLTMAGADTLERAHQWWSPLGEATATLRGDDFADADPESFAVATAPGFALRAQRLADVVRFNRVEGWGTGATVEFTPGAVAPEVSLRANATWAWAERTVRGRVEATRRAERGDWRIGLRAARTLDITNDFTAPADSGGALLAALAGVDDYDYVDRTSATLWFDRTIIPRLATIRMELGASTDRNAHARLTRGLLGGVVPYRPNRGVDAGSYVRSAFVAEWNPVVNAGSLATGVGAMLRGELAAGGLAWQRTTLRVNARADAGAMAYALRVDGGLLTSRNAPAQQLYELGGGRAFPGYAYKEFAGDRAVAAHARALYRLPVLRAPLTVMGCTCLTAPAPALALTLHAASLSSSSAATQASVSRLGTASDSVAFTLAPMGRGVPVSRSTGHLRSSIEVGLRFFGGAATIALARPIDTRAQWQTLIALGQPW